MAQKLLISCQNAGYSETSAADSAAETMWDIQKLNLDLHAGERVCFQFQTEEQKRVLWRLFERKLKPKTGSLRISANIHVHSDQRLLDGLDMKSSMLENLQSRLFENRPWYGGKRMMMDTLMYRLGCWIACFRSWTKSVCPFCWNGSRILQEPLLYLASMLILTRQSNQHRLTGRFYQDLCLIQSSVLRVMERHDTLTKNESIDDKQVNSCQTQK